MHQSQISRVRDKARSLDGLDVPLTVTLRGQGGWWTAICPELMVSGMGSSPMRAMEAVGRSIESTLWVLVSKGHIEKS